MLRKSIGNSQNMGRTSIPLLLLIYSEGYSLIYLAVSDLSCSFLAFFAVLRGNLLANLLHRYLIWLWELFYSSLPPCKRFSTVGRLILSIVSDGRIGVQAGSLLQYLACFHRK